MWILSPNKISLWYTGIIFILIGFAQMGGYLSLITYFLDIIPSSKRVGSTLIITIVSSFIAGFFGALIGAGLLKILENLNLDSHTLFQYFFIVILIILLCGGLLILRLERVNLINTTKNIYKIVLSFKI